MTTANDDEVEKSSQVQHMGVTFGNATTVLAWLGPNANEDDLALRSLKCFWKLDPLMAKAITEPELTTMDLGRLEAFFSKA